MKKPTSNNAFIQSNPIKTERVIYSRLCYEVQYRSKRSRKWFGFTQSVTRAECLLTLKHYLKKKGFNKTNLRMVRVISECEIVK